jgi:tungstate transport system ATP-binding protein
MPRVDKTGAILPLSLEAVTYEAQGQRLIDSLSLVFGAGPRSVILGPNGAGKSLLLRLCHGLLRPTSGRIAWACPGTGAEVRRHQAMAFQRPVLLRRSTLANVTYALALRGVARRHRRELALAALERAGLAELAQRPARVLSGGEQQRLALARAWVQEPQVLFLDEPTANLDPGATRRIEALVDGFHQNGTKIVMTTHDLGQARRLGDEVLFLHAGRLIERGPAAAFFAGPRTPEAAAFMKGDLLV